MIPQVRWWRAKDSPDATAGCAEWFDQTQAYPGFVLTLPKFEGNVRVFRDLAAFESHDGSSSMDLPHKILDEVQPVPPLGASPGPDQAAEFGVQS
jgi:hypothetical protein